MIDSRLIDVNLIDIILKVNKYEQACPKVDFLVTKTDQTIFWGLFSDQTNTNIQKGKLTISSNNRYTALWNSQKQYQAIINVF